MNARINAALILKYARLLPGIAHLVVELGPRRLDEVISLVLERTELAPSKVNSWIKRLAINPSRRRRGGGQKGAAVGMCRSFGSGQLQDRRHDVDEPHRATDSLSRTRAFRQLHNERNVDGLAIEEDPMFGLAMFVESL